MRPFALKDVAKALENEGVDLTFLAQLVKQVATQTIQIQKAHTTDFRDPKTGQVKTKKNPVTGKTEYVQAVSYEIGADGRERPIMLVEEHVNPKAVKDILDFIDRLIEEPPKQVQHTLGLQKEDRKMIEDTRKYFEDNPDIAAELEKKIENADYHILEE